MKLSFVDQCYLLRYQMLQNKHYYLKHCIELPKIIINQIQYAHGFQYASRKKKRTWKLKIQKLVFKK